jgi:hypothetical protein
MIGTRWLRIFKHDLWWMLMPGMAIKARWPVGEVVVGPDHPEGWAGIGEYYETIESADPNDHYRPWLEQNVGHQGWDWNWKMMDDDVAMNRLTIKFRKGRERQAVEAALRWS